MYQIHHRLHMIGGETVFESLIYLSSCFDETQEQVHVFQVTDIDIYSPLNLIRKAPQILIDKNIAYPIEYHLFFLSLGKTNF